MAPGANAHLGKPEFNSWLTHIQTHTFVMCPECSESACETRAAINITRSVCRRAEAGDEAGDAATADKSQLREIVERQRALGLDWEAGTAHLFKDPSAAAVEGGRGGGRGRGRGRSRFDGGAHQTVM